jgi:hypothetical protein
MVLNMAVASRLPEIRIIPEIIILDAVSLIPLAGIYDTIAFEA